MRFLCMLSMLTSVFLVASANGEEKLSTELAKSIRSGDLDAVKAAVEAGADINALDERKMPPIGAAALLGKTDIVNYLADKGADVNRNDGYGFTPLMCAAQRGQAGAVKALLKHGADPSLKGGNGSDALTYAAPKGPADPLYDEKTAVIKAIKEAIAVRKTTVGEKLAPPAVEPPAATPAKPPVAPAANAGAVPAAQPIEASPSVAKNDAGDPVLMEKTGKPIDGVPLSKHNSDIFSPSIAVGRDGTIHVAFCEKQAVMPYAYFVYYRSSTDGGATWSDAKNLSEGLPDTGISRCQVLVDSKNRAYVIWRSDFAPGTMAQTVQQYNVAGNRYNLVYRVLEGGHWSRLTPISHPCTPAKQNDGMATWFAGVDPNGIVQAAWNVSQFPYHPEWFNGQPIYDGRSLVYAASLDGPTPSTPREAYRCPPKGVTYNAAFQKTEDFDAINGYFDAANQPHFITTVTDYEGKADGTAIALVQAGRQAPALNLPGPESQVWANRPTLLLDAKGRQHIIAFYNGGETPAVKDFSPGNTDEPVVIRAARDVSGKIEGYQAFGAVGGQMIVIMQINDTGGLSEAETFVSMSNGGPWSKAVCVTNNKGRQKFQSVNTSAQSYVAQQTRHRPGEGAAGIDTNGHVLLLLIDKEVTMTVSNAFGVNIAGGDTAKPVLRFIKF